MSIDSCLSDKEFEVAIIFLGSVYFAHTMTAAKGLVETKQM